MDLFNLGLGSGLMVILAADWAKACCRGLGVIIFLFLCGLVQGNEYRCLRRCWVDFYGVIC